MAGWFEVGDQDTEPLDAAHDLQPAALRAGIATCILVRPGGHDFDLWSQALADSFPWLSWRLGLTPEPASEPATVCFTVTSAPLGPGAFPGVLACRPDPWSPMADSRVVGEEGEGG